MESIRAGRRFGDWVVVGAEPLGGGGNGEVWLVETADGRSGAVKVLYPREGEEGQYRLARFRDEIGFLLIHPDFPGILPLLDSVISDDLDEPSWYVMPVATPICRALGADPAPDLVVGVVAEIAKTLVALVARGVAHRDIKPDNLFELDGRPVIGDFGLVTYPEKDPRTEHGRKLGPTDYMAPEMRQDADRADPGPADVWALAKTLWVLLTGLDLPLPGTHRSADPAHSLQERITFKFAAELDLMLENATQIEPVKRISMQDMLLELGACTATPPEARESAGLDELHDRMAAVTAVSRERASQTRERRTRVAAAKSELEQIVADAATELNEQLTFYVHSHESGYLAAALLGHQPYSPYDGDSWGWLILPHEQQRPAVEVTVAAAFRLLDEYGPADIAALLRVDHVLREQGVHEPYEVVSATYRSVPVASARQAIVLAEIRAALTDGFPRALQQVLQILAEDAPI